MRRERPGVFLSWPRGRSRGRAVVFGESAFLRAASDIGGPLSEGSLPSIHGIAVRLTSSRFFAGRKRGRKRAAVAESARGAQGAERSGYILYVCMCARSFRRPYVGLVMRERTCSRDREAGTLDETLYRLSPRPERAIVLSRAVALLAPGNVNYAEGAIKPRVSLRQTPRLNLDGRSLSPRVEIAATGVFR